MSLLSSVTVQPTLKGPSPGWMVLVAVVLLTFFHPGENVKGAFPPMTYAVKVALGMPLQSPVRLEGPEICTFTSQFFSLVTSTFFW